MAKDETEFAAACCFSVIREDGSRHFVNGGEAFERSLFGKDAERFDRMLARGRIIERGKGATLAYGSTTATTEDDLEGVVDKTGESAAKGRGKR